MTGSRVRGPIFVGLLLALLAIALQGVQGEEALDQVPSESQCRPYIEKALKDLGTGSLEESSAEVGNGAEDSADKGSSPFNEQVNEPVTDGNKEETDEQLDENDGRDSSDGVLGDNDSNNSGEGNEVAADGSVEAGDENPEKDDNIETVEVTSVESKKDQSGEAASDEDSEGDDGNNETKEGESSEGVAEIGKSDETAVPVSSEDTAEDDDSKDEETEVKKRGVESAERVDDGSIEDRNEDESGEAEAGNGDNEEGQADEAESGEDVVDNDNDSKADSNEVSSEPVDNDDDNNEDSNSNDDNGNSNDDNDDDDDGIENVHDDNDNDNSKETKDSEDDNGDSEEEKALAAEDKTDDESGEVRDGDDKPDNDEDDHDNDDDNVDGDDNSKENEVDADDEAKTDSQEDNEAVIKESAEEAERAPSAESAESDAKSEEETTSSRPTRSERGVEEIVETSDSGEGEDTKEESGEPEKEEEDGKEAEPTPEEDLIQERDIPENLRPRDHINQLLKLDEENEEKERAIQRAADIVLRDLKRLYDNAIKPLETLYKYRDLSNRHFGDPEIFSKPLVLFMGPWSGGKSSIINYLLDNEYTQTSLRTGAEPSPAYFNILMHGEEEVLDGTQLAADWTFSGLQKFGQGMLDRLRGLRLKNELLEKVNIVEIPGILEIRKQVQRLFPFNDACQWFIDRADIIFLVYDPSKLDVGPETEAILDQLKGREYQTRIILNKADQVKPEELMRVQGALIWNISPLMSSAEPPIMYSTSLWSLPYEAGAPTRLLYAQERAFLRDLRSAIDKRVEHKIASARRFAVRVRNHAKMVDCYLTTYYNHKTFFGNKKEISDKIIENPQDYHIYEGLSTLTNISRYDLPDPDVYRDFFRLNALYDFQQLSTTCTYFRGCPINKLDVAIAYDLPELVGKYKKSVEAALQQGKTATTPPAS